MTLREKSKYRRILRELIRAKRKNAEFGMPSAWEEDIRILEAELAPLQAKLEAASKAEAAITKWLNAHD